VAEKVFVVVCHCDLLSFPVEFSMQFQGVRSARCGWQFHIIVPRFSEMAARSTREPSAGRRGLPQPLPPEKERVPLGEEEALWSTVGPPSTSPQCQPITDTKYDNLAMAKIRVTIEFDNSDGVKRKYEKDAPDRNLEKSMENAAQRTFGDLEKDLFFCKASDALPDPYGLYKHGKHTFPMEKVFSGDYFDEMNSHDVWLEIENRMLEVRFLLASARASKGLEPPRGDAFDLQDVVQFHLEKMWHFDMAVFRLAKVEDLLLRLLFEGTGAQFVPLERKNWDRQLDWDRVRDALKDRGIVEKLAGMEDEEYDRLFTLIREFRNPQFVQRFVEYRDRMAHRISPSVDYPELYTHLEDRAWNEIRDDQGRVVMRQKGYVGLPNRAEFQFDDLYQVATKTFDHYLKMLRELQKISVLNPPVIPIEEK
jgi:hypothetical protein